MKSLRFADVVVDYLLSRLWRRAVVVTDEADAERVAMGLQRYGFSGFCIESYDVSHHKTACL